MAIKLLNSDTYSKCNTKEQITAARGSVVNNSDGTVTVFTLNNIGVLTPVPLGKVCCETLDPSYTFDVNSQTCRWSKVATCDFNSPINVNVFSNGNDGSLFLVDNNETCNLKVSFDYIFKIKCESLNKILFPTTTPNPVVLKRINNLNNESSEIYVKIESLENQILLLDEQINATLHSINCDSFPYSDSVIIGPEVPAPTQNVQTSTLKGNFGKSGFGNLSPMSMASVKYYSVNFCLTEPLGLSAWVNVLGEARYQEFLDGIPTSYTCDDVINIYNQNTNGDLLTVCQTPFGAKTELIKQQKILIDELNNLRNTVTDLNQKSNDLQSRLANTTVDCTTPIQALETLNISMNIDVINTDNTIENVFTDTLLNIGDGNLYSYLTNLPANNNNSGLYICGDPTRNDVDLLPCTVLSLNNGSYTPNVSSCASIIQPLINSLLSQSQVTSTEFNKNISSNVFASDWVHYESLITDTTILAKIANKKIKLTFTINNTCVDVCILLDNIVLDKACNIVDSHTIQITQSPGFDLFKVRDNKKSWVSNNTLTNREFLITKNNGTNPLRQTNYNLNDERLVINTKEIDLDINIAGAIENDVWCYLVDNPCILSGNGICVDITGTTTGITFSGNNLITNGTFNSNMNGWTVSPSGNWVSIGNKAVYGGADEGGTMSQNVLTVGKLYKVTFDLFYESPNELILSEVEVKLGSNLTSINYSPGTYLIEVTSICTGNGIFSIAAFDNNGSLLKYKVDNVVVLSSTTITSTTITSNCCDPCLEICGNKQFQDNECFNFQDGTIYEFQDGNLPNSTQANQQCCGDNKIDFSKILTSPLSAVTTIEGFENLLISELIDVKNRKTISTYPTLRALYDRYMNSSVYCTTNSSRFDYNKMDDFSNLIGNYWVDIIEQVIPATTIWGSVKIYSNTIFDEQKFRYRQYSTLICTNPFNGFKLPSPINGVSFNTRQFEVQSETIKLPSNEIYVETKPQKPCNIIYNVQMNSGSEFIGTVTIIGDNTNLVSNNTSFIGETT